MGQMGSFNLMQMHKMFLTSPIIGIGPKAFQAFGIQWFPILTIHFVLAGYGMISSRFILF